MVFRWGRILFTFFLYVSSGMVLSGEYEMESPPLDLTAKVECKNGCELELELKNISENSLEFYRGLLTRDSIVLVVMKGNSYSGALDELSVSDNPSPGVITINPGDKYVRRIDLQRIYPTLKSDLGGSDLILFWSSEIKTVGSKSRGFRFGGYIVIPRTNGVEPMGSDSNTATLRKKSI